MFRAGAQQQAAASASVAAAESELDMVTDLFNRIVGACHQKCIATAYADGELNKGESVCVDRCVSKYFEVNKTVGEKLTEKSQEQQRALFAGGLPSPTA